jgi:thiamine-phosphate pyrophosphorylase
LLGLLHQKAKAKSSFSVKSFNLTGRSISGACVMHAKFSLPRIYPITDKLLARRESHLSILKDLARGGARIVQVRDKITPPRELLPDLMRCMEFAAGRGMMLIVNDRCDLALSSGASGVHLGQEDLPPDAARAILGEEKVLGFSTHSLPQVKKAQSLPVQYIGFGPVYATSTKKDALPPVGLKRLSRACSGSSVPVVAIGGIGLGQVREVLQSGAASVAVISALMQAENIARQMQRFLEQATEK